MIREAEIFFYRFVGWCGVAVIVAALAVPATYAYVTEAQAYCKELNAGTVPATTDTNTLSWLPATIRAAAAIAGLIIPLL